MIVKDEAHCIARCLRSVCDQVDEIIIVDTGSTDQTVEICKSYGAQVFSYTWNHHFAEARNYGIERATGDWILWMDADEEMEVPQAQNLKQLLLSRSEIMAWIQLINYIGEEVNKNEAHHIAHMRLFRNHLGIKFINAVHEMLNIVDLFPYYDFQTTPILPINIFHYGYMNKYIYNKRKSERNIHLLKNELQTENHSPWMKYHLANEYYRLEEYETAFKYVNLAIVHFLQQKKNPPSLVYKLKYAILITLGSAEGAWQAIDKAIQMYPDYVDLHFYKGVIYFLKGWYDKAIVIFEHCIELGEDNIDHLTLKGVGSFHAWYYIGLCHQENGDLDQATHALEKSILLHPTYQEAHQALHTITNPQSV